MPRHSNHLSFKRRIRPRLAGAGLALVLGACSTQRMPDTLVLGGHEQLQPVADNERRLAMLPRAGTNLSAWPNVWIDTVEVKVPELTAEESALVRSTLHEALTTELGKSRRVEAGPGAGVLRVRAAVMVPLLNGGAAAEIAAEDSVTGERVAALVAADDRRFSRQLDYFRRTGHARHVLAAFAREFADIVDPRSRRAGEAPPAPPEAVPPARPRA